MSQLKPKRRDQGSQSRTMTSWEVPQERPKKAAALCTATGITLAQVTQNWLTHLEAIRLGC